MKRWQCSMRAWWSKTGEGGSELEESRCTDCYLMMHCNTIHSYQFFVHQSIRQDSFETLPRVLRERDTEVCVCVGGGVSLGEVV